MNDGPRWTDSHCHLPPDDPHRAGVLVGMARRAGVTRLVNVACDVPQSFAAVMSARGPGDVWATVGIHPHDAATAFQDGSLDLDPIVALIPEAEVVAVGECGLDYHYDHSPREQQREVFAAQVALALQFDVALVIHTREAWDDTFAILESQGVPDRTVFHCFTGGAAEARLALDLGAHLSFSGIVTFPSAGDVRDAARLCPKSRLLIETDSPYLAPVPLRGSKNVPANLPHVGAGLAETRGERVEEIAEITWENAEAVFHLA